MTVAGTKKLVAESDDKTPPSSHTPEVQAELLPPSPAENTGKHGGRKKGQVNRSTKQWSEYVNQTGANPLELWAEIVRTPVPVLQVKYTLGPKDALQLQMSAAKELAPYVAQKRPIAIEGGEGNAPVIVIGHISAEQAGDLGMDASNVLDLENAEDSDT